MCAEAPYPDGWSRTGALPWHCPGAWDAPGAVIAKRGSGGGPRKRSRGRQSSSAPGAHGALRVLVGEGGGAPVSSLAKGELSQAVGVSVLAPGNHPVLNL